MRIVLVLKPYAIEVHSYENDVYTLIGVESITRIEGESLFDYEKRMVFVCKDLCNDMRDSSFFKAVAKKVESIDIVLCAPWCTYEVIQIEKDLGRPTKITSKMISSMYVKKDIDDMYIVESYTSNILLNGYRVPEIDGQTANTVQLQYVHVYTTKTFAASLIKSIESIFHTHKITLTSIYALVDNLKENESKKTSFDIRIVVEEESIDISYIAEGFHVLNIFLPYSYMHLKNTLAMRLSTRPEVVDQILISRGDVVDISVDKNSKKLWPDLDSATKTIIDDAVGESLDQILKSTRDYIDTLDMSYTKDSVLLSVYSIDDNLMRAYGKELAMKIISDPYISMKAHIDKEHLSIEHIF